jgi:hypothetical protein
MASSSTTPSSSGLGFALPPGLSAQEQQQLISLYQYEMVFPDFPANFSFPSVTDPNYVAPDRRGAILAVVILCTVVASLITILRLVVRYMDRTSKTKAWTIDDYFACAALVCISFCLGIC